MQVLEIDISDMAGERLKDIRRLLGLRTTRELFQNALVILYWVASARQKGQTIVAIDQETGEHKELTLPFLKRTAKNSASDLQIDQSPAVLGDEFAEFLK